MNWLKHLTTGRDNETADLGRWSWIGSFLAVIGHSIWTAAHGGAVDILLLAQALGAVAGVHGAALWAKKDTEPAPKDPA